MSADGLILGATGTRPAWIRSTLRTGRRLAGCFRGRPLAIAAAAVLLLVIVVAVFAGQLAPDDPLHQNLADAFRAPSGAHLLGTDNLGRDTLSRIMFAAGVALPAAAVGVGVAIGVGIPVGLLIGYAGGVWDLVAMRVVDALLALPGLVVAIAVLAGIGPGITHAMLALGFLAAPGAARLARGVVLAEREEVYVDAARVVGEAPVRILRREILPNIAGPLVVHTTISFGIMLLAESSLSFIGLGVQPPQASWGSMLTTANEQLYRDAFLAVPPGLALLLTVLAVNIVGDALRTGLIVTQRVTAPPPRVRRRSLRVRAPVPVAVGDPDPDLLLTVRDLTVEVVGPVGPVALLDGLDLDVRRGEILGVVGESGCGKSMTALAIMGLLAPGVSVRGGHIRFDGDELVGMSDRALDDLRGRRIGMIFQDPHGSLDPAFKVIDQVAEPLRIHRGLSRRAAYRQAVELLERVHLPQATRRAYDYPHQLSGGQAQRVMIAAALACDPTLLIADEPTTALDVTVQGRILDLLTELQDEIGMSIMLLTHDLGVVADVCQRVVVMYAGQVVETEPVDALFRQPRHPYSEALLHTVPDVDRPQDRLAQIPGRVPAAADRSMSACRFASRCAYARPLCQAAMPAMTPPTGTSRSRCARVDELELAGPGR